MDNSGWTRQKWKEKKKVLYFSQKCYENQRLLISYTHAEVEFKIEF